MVVVRVRFNVPDDARVVVLAFAVVVFVVVVFVAVVVVVVVVVDFLVVLVAQRITF